MREKKLAAAKPAPRLTKRQLSRHQREVRLQRIAIGGVALALFLVLLVPLYGYWREVLTRGDQPIAVVHGQAYSTELYARLLGYEQLLLQREVKRVSDKLASPDEKDADKQNDQLTLQLLQQRAQYLPGDALDLLVDGKIIQDEAARRGLTASPEELDAALQRELSDYSLAGFIYGSAASAPPANGLTVEQAKQELGALLGKGKFLTAGEVTDLVLKSEVLRDKVKAAVTESVPTSGEQVRARHILVDTEDQAKAALDRLNKGEAFAAVAKDVSKDTSNKDQGGELGWFGKGKMDPAFEAAAFSLKVGETSPPVKSSFGYHIIQVEERADNRPYDASDVDQQRAQAFGGWLSAQRTSDPQAVQQLATSDRIQWATDYVSRELQGAK